MGYTEAVQPLCAFLTNVVLHGGYIHAVGQQVGRAVPSGHYVPCYAVHGVVATYPSALVTVAEAALYFIFIQKIFTPC